MRNTDLINKEESLNLEGQNCLLNNSKNKQQNIQNQIGLNQDSFDNNPINLNHISNQRDIDKLFQNFTKFKVPSKQKS